VWQWNFLKWINLILKKSNSRNSRMRQIRGRERHEEAEIGPSAVEEKPSVMLNCDVSPKPIDKASKEADRTSEEVVLASKESVKEGGGGGKDE
jgi:hypothetical protein